ncbi:hypothetical protein PLICRDRAFT_57876 [Plicaturopsis crispa FD-325 SS-3]|uniref:SUI1 domain-containing protein n=1 Tax=Plicaturopsis crispa FD-325 SS-3 TaxID=944288 RepID=A0A0C9SWZ5_PLICR|nr:hypothetical protein PLICRDRAFT_57876 [Plicaturopsis crispa FD-325 SS-3]
MFKKPLAHLKTSAPLRSSDRRKLKQRALQTFAIPAEEGDALVPDGLLAVKFSTHLDEPGVAYLSPDGDPLWFTLGIGKEAEDLIPTVYTLWKRPTLLPFLSTPSAVIPVLVGGADLMIPGVVECAPDLSPGRLVSITQYAGPGKRGPPLAVGRMVVSSGELIGDEGGGIEGEGRKGKAVRVLHTWKDHLWEVGKGGDVPEVVVVNDGQVDGGEASAEGERGPGEGGGVEESGESANGVLSGEAQSPPLSPQEVSTILRTSLLQALSTTLSALPHSALPLPAPAFYSTYILPARPYHPPPSASSTPIDIKHSAFKSLSAFLKSTEKDGLLKLKETKADGLVVVGVSPKHAEVAGHRGYVTIKDIETKRERAEKREKEREREGKGEMEVTELWKPWQGSVAFFDGVGKETTKLYAHPELKSILNEYITAQHLVNPREQQYVNVDALLRSFLVAKSKPKPGAEPEPPLEFIKREEILAKLLERMQPWHEIRVDAKEPSSPKKGALKPISVVTKIRQGRKASTLIAGFEPFGLEANFLAEELRHACASATSVSPIAGKGSALEVLVQGKQIKAVTELLASQGVPRKWVAAADLGDGKKR